MWLKIPFVLFIPFLVFGFVTFGDEVTRTQKFYIIFVYILQGKMGKMEKNRKVNHATKVTEIPKTNRQKHFSKYYSVLGKGQTK